jgi:hypothetical protein
MDASLSMQQPDIRSHKGAADCCKSSAVSHLFSLRRTTFYHRFLGQSLSRRNGLLIRKCESNGRMY